MKKRIYNKIYNQVTYEPLTEAAERNLFFFGARWRLIEHLLIKSGEMKVERNLSSFTQKELENTLRKEYFEEKYGKQPIKLFLDDERKAPRGMLRAPSGERLIKFLKENYNKDKRQIEVLSFDHDLGLNKLNGYETIKKIINECPEVLNYVERIQVHSNNMVGAESIVQYLTAAKKANVIPDNLYIDNHIYQYSARKLVRTEYSWVK